MVGRNPKPTALRIIQGNPGKRPLPKSEPKPRLLTPRAPAYLDATAKAWFKTHAKILARMKVMTDADTTALAMAAESWSIYRKAIEHIEVAGMYIETPNGMPAQSPAMGVRNVQWKQIQKILAEFGMTPSSRSGVQTIGEDKKAADVYDKYYS